MITTINESDELTYAITVHGIDQDTFEQLAGRFESRRGGARPHDLSLYISFSVGLNEVDESLTWISQNLVGRYSELYFSVSALTKLHWGELLIPPNIASIVGTHGAVLKIMFTCPGPTN